MTLDPLDAEGLVAAGAGTAWQGLEAETVMGHVHLHVAALAAAEQFYVDTVGFALQQRFGAQADFVAAGGYHHHLGLNIWAGQGAPPPPEDHARLLWFEVVLPSAPALDEVLGRLQRRGIGAVAQEAGWFVRDPAGNGLRLRVASAAAAA
jgi:catechol 2,3-dioxygenase